MGILESKLTQSKPELNDEELLFIKDKNVICPPQKMINLLKIDDINSIKKKFIIKFFFLFIYFS